MATHRTTHVADVHIRDPGDRRRVGDRFWALADRSDEDDKEDGEAATGISPEVSSLMPSDAIYEALKVGYSEEDVALLVDAVVSINDPARLGMREDDKVEITHRVVHCRTAAMAVRLGKVRYPRCVSLILPCSISLGLILGRWCKGGRRGIRWQRRRRCRRPAKSS